MLAQGQICTISVLLNHLDITLSEQMCKICTWCSTLKKLHLLYTSTPKDENVLCLMLKALVGLIYEGTAPVRSVGDIALLMV